MTAAGETTQVQPVTPRKDSGGVWLVFLLSLAAFLVLSRFLLVAPDTVVTTRNNVLFETDSGVRLRYLTDPTTQPHRLEFAQHPAFFLVWRPMALAIELVLRPILPDSAAAVLAAQLLVCAFAALAATMICVIARRWQATPFVAAQLTALFILATGSVLLVVPEHWAMASALMLASFALVSTPGQLPTKRVILLGVLAALIAGTTVTNVMFAALLLVTVLHMNRWRRAERVIDPLVAVIAIAGAVFVLPRLLRMPAVSGFFNLRIMEDPGHAALYALFGLVAPIIGPAPWRTWERGHVVLTYEPVSFSQYSLVQWLGVAAWAGLFAACVWRALAAKESRGWALWLLAWAAMNIVFHNLWGDEFFLYSPHWCWALVGVAALGVARLPWPAVTTAVVILGVAQIHTITIIGEMLRAP